MVTTRAVIAHDLGIMDYEVCLKRQQCLHEEVVKFPVVSHMLFVQHPPVITLGKNCEDKTVYDSMFQFEKEGIKVVSTDRGGNVTAHMPGQLVWYPILPVQSLKLTPKKIVNMILDIGIDVLSAYGLEAYVHDRFPGVWCCDKKLASIGLRIKNRVTYHGLALNVCNDMSLFSRISPCGLTVSEMSSLSEMLDRNIDVAEVTNRITESFEKKTGLRPSFSDR